nr:hypothetical protein Hi04_10k_c2089_00013 [uncultured bacterium]
MNQDSCAHRARLGAVRSLFVIGVVLFVGVVLQLDSSRALARTNHPVQLACTMKTVQIFIYTDIGTVDMTGVDTISDGHVYDPNDRLVGVVDVNDNIIDSNNNTVGYIVN